MYLDLCQLILIRLFLFLEPDDIGVDGCDLLYAGIDSTLSLLDRALLLLDGALQAF